MNFLERVHFFVYNDNMRKIKHKPLSDKELVLLQGKDIYIDFILRTGLRISEVRMAISEWKNNPEKTYVTIHTKMSKDDKNTINFTDYVLKNILPKLKLYSVRWYQNHIKEVALKLANIDISPHNLRSTFATLAHRQGVSLEIIRELMNHSDIGQTSKYIYMDEQSKIQALESIERALKFEPSKSFLENKIIECNQLRLEIQKQKRRTKYLENELFELGKEHGQ